MRSALTVCLLSAMVAPISAAATEAVQAEDRPAGVILEELDAIERPSIDPAKVQDREAVRAYSEAVQKASRARAGLILELFRAHPDHPRVPELLVERWQSPHVAGKPEDLITEADEALARIADEKLRTAAFYLKAMLAIQIHRDDLASAEPAVEEFLKAVPGDPRGPGLLYYGLARNLRDESKRTAIEERILKDFPDSSATVAIKGQRKQRESIGKPFHLEFTDAVDGTNVSIAGLKGKVVVIDFWATWCGPCVAEMPRMKELYARYHDQGVEFIGVSLDRPEADGGLKALKEYVAKNDIRWPQYYQGNHWQSEFSTSWGIRAIPSLFVVDKEGNLASVEARGKLESLIPELLARGEAEAP